MDLFVNLGIAADIAYANSPLAGQGKSNIVLLGAEGASPLVKGAFDGVVSTFRYDTSHPMTLHDGLRNESCVAKLAGDHEFVTPLDVRPLSRPAT